MLLVEFKVSKMIGKLVNKLQIKFEFWQKNNNNWVWCKSGFFIWYYNSMILSKFSIKNKLKHKVNSLDIYLLMLIKMCDKSFT